MKLQLQVFGMWWLLSMCVVTATAQAWKLHEAMLGS